MRRTLAKGVEKFCPKNFPHEESVRGNRARQVLCDRTIRRCQYAKLFLLSSVPEECLCAHTWTSWSVAAFPRQSSLCPWSALASRNTWVARAGFALKSIKWECVGASEGENQKGSPCGTWSWASVCKGLDHRWSWCRWPSVASSDKSVLPGACAEDGRKLWTDWEAVGAVRANRRAIEYRSSLDTSSHSWFTLLFCFYSIIVTGMLPRILLGVVGWAKAHHFYSFDFKERGVSLSGCHGCYRPFCCGCHTRVINARVSCGCCGWSSVPRCSFWRVSCVDRHLRQISGKWVQS